MTQCECVCVCVSYQLELVTSELVNHLSRHWHYLGDWEVRSPSHRRLQVDGEIAIVLARRVSELLDILQRTQWSTPSPEDLASEKTRYNHRKRNTNDFHPDWSVEGSEGDPVSGQQKCAPK